MAARTKLTSTIAFPVQSRALAHSLNAAGAASLQAGFGRTAEDDLLFALGYPMMALLVEQPDAQALAEEVKHSEFFLRETWPRALAPGLIRGDGTPVRFVEGPYGPTPGDAGPTTAAFADRSPMDEPEAKTWLRRLLTPEAPGEDVPAAPTRSLFLLEALHGPSLVLAGLLEALPALDLSLSQPALGQALTAAGAMLLRVPVAEAGRIRGALEQCFQHFAEHPTDPAGLVRAEPIIQHALNALDLVLHGKAAAVRNGARTRDGVPTREATLFVHDDPAFVADVLRKRPLRKGAGWHTSARFVFVGGTDVLDLEAEQWPFYTSSKRDQPYWLSTFGRIADPRVDDIALQMALSSKNAKKEALAFLLAHPREGLAACARRGATAAPIRKKLEAAR